MGPQLCSDIEAPPYLNFDSSFPNYDTENPFSDWFSEQKFWASLDTATPVYTLYRKLLC